MQIVSSTSTKPSQPKHRTTTISSQQSAKAITSHLLINHLQPPSKAIRMFVNLIATYCLLMFAEEAISYGFNTRVSSSSGRDRYAASLQQHFNSKRYNKHSSLLMRTRDDSMELTKVCNTPCYASETPITRLAGITNTSLSFPHRPQ